MVARFFQSILLNPAIHSVTLSRGKLAGSVIAGFLDVVTSVTTFGIYDCVVEESKRDQGVIDLAASIQRNTRIRTLSLSYLDDSYLCPILSSLASNSHAKELEVCLRNPSREASNAMKHLMESTASIENRSS
jgi:hypothetical protein